MIIPKYTTPGMEKPAGDASPTLLYHKPQGYDCFHDAQIEEKGKTKHLEAFKHKEVLRMCLGQIAQSVSTVMGDRYPDWHRAYVASLADLGVDTQSAARIPTAWRLVVGWGTNPSLETGITLHHLLGFPLIPGSAVKGLLHHVAEMELMEDPDAIPEAPPQIEDTPPPRLLAAIARAKLVRAVFGSLFVERHVDKSKKQYGPMTPSAMLKQWKQRIIDANKHEPGSPWHQAFNDLSVLTGTTATGGMITCYDAVPTPGSESMHKEIVQVDILNPHYPDYYKDHAKEPTDDQNPNPVYFLAVRPRTPFEFYYRLDPMPQARARDDAEKERSEALCLTSEDDLQHMMKRWLQQGLELWGIGAKTAAGYGYFEYGSGHAESAPSDKATGSDTHEQANIIQRPAKRTPSAEERARELLPLDLIPGELESRVLSAMQEAKEVQGEVARLLRQHYSDQIRRWRKKAANKPAVRKRVEWLDSFPLSEDQA